jgi:hypothetical protein
MEVFIQTDVKKLKEGEVTDENWLVSEDREELDAHVQRTFDMQVQMYGISFTEMRWTYYDNEGEEIEETRTLRNIGVGTYLETMENFIRPFNDRVIASIIGGKK